MAPPGSPPCPSPSPCRLPAPTSTSLQSQPAQGAPTTRHSLLPHTSLPPLHLPLTPTRHLCPLFGYAPKASLRLPCPSPHLLAPDSLHTVPEVDPAFTAPCSRSLRPRRLCATPLSLPSLPSTFPSRFSPDPSPPSRAPPPPTAPPPGTRSRPGSPARPPPSRRWCGCCSWNGTVALSGCNPARGEPAGAGGEQPRRSPPAPPRPGPQGPPPLPPAAAPAIVRPTTCLPRPHSEPHTAPQPPLLPLICSAGRRPAPSAQNSHWPTESQTPPPNQSLACSSHSRG